MFISNVQDWPEALHTAVNAEQQLHIICTSFFAAYLYPTAQMMGREKKEEVRISGTECLHPSDNKKRTREYVTVKNTHVLLKDLSRLSESPENISSGS